MPPVDTRAFDIVRATAASASQPTPWAQTVIRNNLVAEMDQRNRLRDIEDKDRAAVEQLARDTRIHKNQLAVEKERRKIYNDARKEEREWQAGQKKIERHEKLASAASLFGPVRDDKGELLPPDKLEGLIRTGAKKRAQALRTEIETLEKQGGALTKVTDQEIVGIVQSKVSGLDKQAVGKDGKTKATGRDILEAWRRSGRPYGELVSTLRANGLTEAASGFEDQYQATKTGLEMAKQDSDAFKGIQSRLREAEKSMVNLRTLGAEVQVDIGIDSDVDEVERTRRQKLDDAINKLIEQRGVAPARPGNAGEMRQADEQRMGGALSAPQVPTTVPQAAAPRASANPAAAFGAPPVNEMLKGAYPHAVATAKGIGTTLATGAGAVVDTLLQGKASPLFGELRDQLPIPSNLFERLANRLNAITGQKLTPEKTKKVVSLYEANLGPEATSNIVNKLLEPDPEAGLLQQVRFELPKAIEAVDMSEKFDSGVGYEIRQ